MSDLLKEMMGSIGVEFLLENTVDVLELEHMDSVEKKIFADFDHITAL